MNVHEFVDGQKPVMVLIHGVLTPWQVWMPQIEAFKEQYNIYAVALSAHTEESASEFTSLDAEAGAIEQYFASHGLHNIEVLCGISFGGKIAYELWKRNTLTIRNLVMDGAPLLSCPKFAQNIMIKNYTKIIHRSKLRDKKVLESFKKQFLPEKYLDSYLKIADFMTDQSMENVVRAAFSDNFSDNVTNKSKILFIHGTKGNEILAKKAAIHMQKCYPETRIHCFKGDNHCYKAIYEPEKWIEVVEGFLK